MQLLAVGRSFVGLRTDQSRYKMVEQHVLPRFGNRGKWATHRAEQSFTSSDRQVNEPVLPGKCGDLVSIGVAASVAGDRPEERVTRDAAVPIAQPPEPQTKIDTEFAVAARDEQPALLGTGHSGFRPNRPESRARRSILQLLRLRKQPAPAPRKLVQSELALDAVKVVRNDLADADVEVVRGRPERKEQRLIARKPEPTFTADVESEPAVPGSRWTWLSARLFEANRS